MDLCAGTHVRYTSKIKAFKLLSIAGAYHRGDEHNAQLQRVYGTAFPTKEELAAYLEQMEQAKLRDHRKLGRDLKLFVIDDDVGQGLILWTPAGSIIRQELQNFISEELRKQGYQQVFTPHIGKLEPVQDLRTLPVLQGVAVHPRSSRTRRSRESCGRTAPARRWCPASTRSPSISGRRSTGAPARKPSRRSAPCPTTGFSTASCSSR